MERPESKRANQDTMSNHWREKKIGQMHNSNTSIVSISKRTFRENRKNSEPRPYFPCESQHSHARTHMSFVVLRPCCFNI